MKPSSSTRAMYIYSLSRHFRIWPFGGSQKRCGSLIRFSVLAPDIDTVALQAGIAQAQGDLLRAAGLLAPLHPNADEIIALEAQVYQAILKRRPARIIPRVKEYLPSLIQCWFL